MQDAVASGSGAWVQPGDLHLPWQYPIEPMEGSRSIVPDRRQDSVISQRERETAGAQPISFRVQFRLGAVAGPERPLSRSQPRTDQSCPSLVRQNAMYPHPATLGRDPGTERRPHVTSEADGDPNLDRAIIRHIRRVLDGVRGNKLQAARLLGISRSTLYRLLSGDGGGAEDKARE
jgi:hypothetical protein